MIIKLKMVSWIKVGDVPVKHDFAILIDLGKKYTKTFVNVTLDMTVRKYRLFWKVGYIWL